MRDGRPYEYGFPMRLAAAFATIPPVMSGQPHRPDQLRQLQALTDAALAHLDLNALLAALLDRVREILDVDTCAILLREGATDELVARAAVGIEEEVEQGVRIPVGYGFAGRIAAEKRPVMAAVIPMRYGSCASAGAGTALATVMTPSAAMRMRRRMSALLF